MPPSQRHFSPQSRRLRESPYCLSALMASKSSLAEKLGINKKRYVKNNRTEAYFIRKNEETERKLRNVSDTDAVFRSQGEHFAPIKWLIGGAVNLTLSTNNEESEMLRQDLCCGSDPGSASTKRPLPTFDICTGSASNRFPLVVFRRHFRTWGTALRWDLQKDPWG